MFSNIENVNILTALLPAHGISHAVVCPGNRNAPIVHNLNECPDIVCHPVTDERSAAFYALGMAQATGEPVAVCVTSGTALLNVAPAVAEACHQHVPLIVVSADRPAAWIGQLDGQTMQQAGALTPWVAQSVSLPEVTDDVTRWHCNRLTNEALLRAQQPGRPCVHINVPISEPLFHFTESALPPQRRIGRYAPLTDYDCMPAPLVEQLLNARRPMLVFGQACPADFTPGEADWLLNHMLVYHEALAPLPGTSHFDEVLYALQKHQEIDISSYEPDFVIQVGDAIVSKRMKAFLRQARNTAVWRISPHGEVEDTFMHLQGIVTADPDFALSALSHKMPRQHKEGMAFRRQWLQLLRQAAQHGSTFTPPYSQMAAVRAFEQELATTPDNMQQQVHYANSSAIRLANIYSPRHVWCNRGVNGIEGSLSTACGFALVSGGPVFCVIGDLSFFYDQNALWNQQVRTTPIRILLLNNGGGGIFAQMRPLQASAAARTLVGACHQATAQGICMQNGVEYAAVHNSEELQSGINHLVHATAPHPILLEVFTRQDDDAAALTQYYDLLAQQLQVPKT